MTQFSRLRRAAVVLRHLPKASSARILSRLEARDLQTVFAALNDLDRTATQPFFDALEALAREAQQQEQSLPAGGAEQQAQSQAIAATPEVLAAAAENPFGFLFSRSAGEVRELLRDEHPRNIALVLGHLPHEAAGDVLRHLEPLQRLAVVKRMCESGQQDPGEVSSLSLALRHRLKKQAAAPPVDQREHLRKILDAAGPEIRDELGSVVESCSPHGSRATAARTDNFSQLEECSAAELRELFARLDDSLWAAALREARASTRLHVLAALDPADSRRVGRKILDRSSEVSLSARQAQRKILDALCDLREARPACG